MRLDFNNLTASRLLSQSSRTLARALERLASGNRLQNFADDPVSAGQAIRLTSSIQQRRIETLSLNQTQSLATVTSSALSQQTDLLQKMRELAVQATNSTLSSADRRKISDEVRSLSQEFDRIAKDANFNGKNLIYSNNSSVTQVVGDSLLKLQLSSTRSSQTIQELANTGKFSAVVPVSMTATADFFLSGDFNNDGRQDSVTIGSNQITSFLVDGVDKPTAVIQSGSFDFAFASTIDVNGDGFLDLLGLSSVGLLSTHLGNGDGTFKIATTTLTGADGIVVGDLNNDGRGDIVTFEGKAINVLISKGDGTYQKQSLNQAENSATVALGDLNNDGALDILVGSADSNTAFAYLGNVTGQFSSTISATINITQPRNFSLHDFNHDGYADLFYEEDGVGAYYAVNNQNLSFSVVSSLGTQAFEVDFLDVNHDGFMDVISSQTDGVRTFINNSGHGFSVLGVEDSVVSKVGGFIDANGDGVWDRLRGYGTGVGIAFGLGRLTAAGSYYHLSTLEDAQALIGAIDNGLEKINENQTKLAIFSDQLDLIKSQNEKLIETQEEARARLKDTDYAQELAQVTAEQIRQQAQIAALTQMQISWRVVLSLLQT